MKIITLWLRVQKINYVNDLFEGQIHSNVTGRFSIKKAMVEIDLNKNGVLVVIKDNKSQFAFKEKEEKRTLSLESTV